MSLLDLFCHVDDFWMQFKLYWYSHLLTIGTIKRIREPRLSNSEIMTIMIHFHQSGYRTFKGYYIKQVTAQLSSEFPNLVSYNRFVELMPTVVVPLLYYLKQCTGEPTGLAFIDATPIRVCHNLRISRHKVFSGLAQRGKTSIGWFYGFKLHLIVNDKGEILTFYITPGNVDDRKPVPQMTKELFGKLFGDKGYISQPLFEALFERGLELITPIKKNMRNRLMPLWDKLLLRKRSIIETINDQLKNISQVEHSRHRSVNNFIGNLVSGLIAYCHQPKKPSLNLEKSEFQAISNSIAIPN